MERYAGIDVSLELSSVCASMHRGRSSGRRRSRASPKLWAHFFGSLDFAVKRIGLEAGPL